MKNISLVIALLAAGIVSAQKGNSLLDQGFWKKNPDVSTVKAEIEKGNDPSASNSSAFDPTTLAINNGASIDVVKFLIDQKGNDVKKATHDARTYLHWASGKGNLELVDYLINKGSDINIEDSHDATPLVYAAQGGQNNVALFEMFFKAGLDPKKKYKNNATILMLTIPNDKDLSLTNYLVSKGLSLKDVDSEGNTVFDYAARTGNITNLKTLVSKGVKFTPNALLFAAEASRRTSNPIEVFQYLVDDLKIKPTTLSKNKESVLHFIAKKENQSAIVNYFLSKGVDVNLADAEGNTSLMNASAGRDAALVNLLLEKGTKVNEANAKGETAIFQAVKSGSVDIINALLNKNASLTILDKDNHDVAYHLVQNYRAPRGGNDDFLDKLNLLKSKGVSLQSPQKDGNTLYHLAVGKNDLNLVKKLEGLSININAKNAEGLTALHKAALVAKDDSLLKYIVTLNADKSIKTDFDETAYDIAKENEVLVKNQVNIDFLK
jgi:uncharacterized protein